MCKIDWKWLLSWPHTLNNKILKTISDKANTNASYIAQDNFQQKLKKN